MRRSERGCLLPPSFILRSYGKSLDQSRRQIADYGYNFAVSASEIIKELPKLSEAERRAVFNKLCELAEGDRRWEEIIDDERPRPKLDAFVEKARAEGSEPLDLNKL